MGQNREPPAYQEYASAMLSKLHFRSMNLEQRGLLYTMRLECWVNGRLPSNSEDLALVLGKEITHESLDSVMWAFRIEGEFILCPELDDYREHLTERKRKQSEGGKKGAKITNQGRASSSDITSSSKAAAKSRGTRRGSDESLVQSSAEQQSQNQLIGKGVINYNGLDDVPY